VKQAISENNRIVLDLGEVSYIDSGGWGTLVAVPTTALNAGGTIKLANLTAPGRPFTGHKVADRF
jgi:anti-anti-sigma regulatory factor